METVLEITASFMWGNGIMILLLLTGTVCTFRTGMIQISLPRFIIKQIKRKEFDRKQFRIVCTSLGTAMGTGNITGVAAALMTGGPGAIFWMWVSAFLGMAVVYSENKLSASYSSSELNGPFSYIRYGLGSRFMTLLFATGCCGASCGMGGMTQVSSAIEVITSTFHVSPSYLAVSCFILIYAVISGGAERIRTFAQYLLPGASVLYAVICIAVIIHFRANLLSVFGDIIGSAFGLRQTSGGILGYTLSKTIVTGLRRGIFSNEAGLGSSPLLHSDTRSGTQGMWAMLEVFIDTFVCCTLTALALLCSSSEITVISAFSTILGSGAVYIVSIILTVFAFCTILGWYYCGDKGFCYLTGRKHRRAFAVIFTLLASLGAIISAPSVWAISDICNGLMAFPNLAAILFVSNYHGSGLNNESDI